MEEYHGEDTTERVLGGLDRTKRRYKTVPSLFQLCMNMLVDHCDCMLKKQRVSSSFTSACWQTRASRAERAACVPLMLFPAVDQTRARSRAFVAPWYRLPAFSVPLRAFRSSSLVESSPADRHTFVPNVTYPAGICELGSVPADLIDPVFKKCTARQLENIEYYNPVRAGAVSFVVVGGVNAGRAEYSRQCSGVVLAWTIRPPQPIP